MLIEEMPLKIYKWQKRKKEQQTKQLYKRRRRGGAHMVFSTGGGEDLKLLRWLNTQWIQQYVTFGSKPDQKGMPSIQCSSSFTRIL